MTSVSQQEIQQYLDGSRELHDLVGLSDQQMVELRGRAQFFVDTGNVERALIMLEMIEELDRTDPTPTLVAASLLLGEGRSDAAQAKVEAALARHPESADVRVALAELKIATADLVGAAEVLREVIDADPKGETPAGQRAQAVAAEAHARYGDG